LALPKTGDILQPFTGLVKRKIQKKSIFLQNPVTSYPRKCYNSSTCFSFRPFQLCLIFFPSHAYKPKLPRPVQNVNQNPDPPTDSSIFRTPRPFHHSRTITTHPPTHQSPPREQLSPPRKAPPQLDWGRRSIFRPAPPFVIPAQAGHEAKRRAAIANPFLALRRSAARQSVTPARCPCSSVFVLLPHADFRVSLRAQRGNLSSSP